MRWLELATRVDNEVVEAVGEVFRRVAYGGGIVIEPDLESITDEATVYGKTSVVRAYLALDGRAEKSRVLRSTEEALWHLRSIWAGADKDVGLFGELTSRELAEEDWANAWKAHYRIVRLGQGIVVQPAWLTYTPAPGETVVVLDPGQAFGTGLHPTTQLCLEAIEALDLRGKSVLDVGTGSGILAIAAARLGARSVLAVDVDPIAVEAARSNTRLNFGGSTVNPIPVEIREGSAEVAPDQPYDLVVANIIARVILDLADELARRVGPAGMLLLSGILAERADDVAQAFETRGFAVERRAREDWTALLARRADAR